MKGLTLGAAKQYDMIPVFRTVVADAVNSYEDFVGVIDYMIKRKISSMARGRHNLQGMSEDQLTGKIADQFEELGFLVSHDKQIGGHADIVLEYDEYLWLGEAKIHGSYTTLQKGWYQLTTRYMTGLPNENAGSFIIYNFNKDALSVTNEWRSVLQDFQSGVELGEIEDGLNFASSLIHEGSGLPIKVNHYNIPLYHKPKDK